MRGTTTEQTPAIRRIPPRMTTRASRATATPVVRAGTEKLSASAPAMELAWAMSPMPREARTVKRAKRKARAPPSRFHRRAAHMVYMGPPRISPPASRWRYLTASRHSAHLEERPKRAEISIHTKAPGPPATKAVATPTMFPVPMVAASVVIRAEKGDTSPAPPALARESRPRTLFSAQPRFRQGRKRVRRVRKTPVPISSTSIPGPQTRWSTYAIHSETVMEAAPSELGDTSSIASFRHFMPSKTRTPVQASARERGFSSPCAGPDRRRWSGPACTRCRR